MEGIKLKDVVKASAQQRSGISSPYFDLGASIALAEAVLKHGGGTCSPDQLAAWLGYKSTGSGTFLTRLSAASKHFGLVDVSGQRIAISERAHKILAPVMPEDAVQAKVDAFLSPTLFSKVFERFRGTSLPPEVGLKNLFLNEYKVLPDRVAQAVRIFLNSADQAGFFQASGDRTRLVKPSFSTQPILVPASAPVQSEATHEKPRFGGAGGDGPSGIHSAISGLLRELPPPGTPWSAVQKQRFFDAFRATIDFIYPEESQS